MEEEELEEEDPIDYDEPDDVEPVRMTIKDYPIGWDGKPIPYWLYKLHGLGVEYKCEICGNTSYFGRKAFEKHFQVCSSNCFCLHVSNLFVVGMASRSWYGLPQYSEYTTFPRDHAHC